MEYYDAIWFQLLFSYEDICLIQKLLEYEKRYLFCSSVFYNKESNPFKTEIFCHNIS